MIVSQFIFIAGLMALIIIRTCSAVDRTQLIVLLVIAWVGFIYCMLQNY